MSIRTAGSPVIDAGDNVGAGEATVDLEGNARFVDDPETLDTGRGQPPLVDMGATERQADACPADVDGDGTVGFGDVVAILAAWGHAGGAEDVDESGFVGFGDVLLVLAAWGPCDMGSL